MKIVVICILTAAVFATPCIYDFASKEPSPLAGLLAVAQAGSPAQTRPPAADW